MLPSDETTSLNEILHLYTVSRSNMLRKVKLKLGAFVHQTIANAAQLGRDESLESIDSMLRHLFNFEEVDLDLLTMVQFLGLNDLAEFNPKQVNGFHSMALCHAKMARNDCEDNFQL